jgi:hydroxyacylglutathione hydrolase
MTPPPPTPTPIPPPLQPQPQPQPQPLVSRAGRFLTIHDESFVGVGISSNVYIAESEGKYYIFDASGSPDLLPFIEVSGIPGGYIGAVFLTHGHYDHVAGIKSLSKLEVPVYISTKDKELMECTTGPIPSNDISEGEGVLKSLGLAAIVTPGHTPGSVCFYSASEALLISGDTVFADGYFGRTDLPGGSDRDMLDSLKALEKLKLTSVLPGHGEYTMEGGSEAISSALSNAMAMLLP